MKILRICMPANYLTAICLSMIIWINQQSSNVWPSSMPERVYYDRILTMTAWKINHLEKPLKELVNLRNQMRVNLKCRTKPSLKLCQTYRKNLVRNSFLEEYLLSYAAPQKWVHWSIPEKIDEDLATFTDQEIEDYLEGVLNLLPHLDRDIVTMHALSEKLSRYLKRKHSAESYQKLSHIPWWYFIVLLLFVLLNISLYNYNDLTVDENNES